MSSSSSNLSDDDQLQLIEKLQIFRIQGTDKRGRKVVVIIGKYFPARLISGEVLKRYLEESIFSRLGDKAFSVVYVHTGVQKSDNCPGVSALRLIYEAIPVNVRDHIEAVYFLHPGLQARLFFATFGRFLFNGGLYQKLQYVNRLEFLWNHVRRNGIEIPEFVLDHDEELEHRPMMDYGLESDHPRTYASSTHDSPVGVYSMRCIA